MCRRNSILAMISAIYKWNYLQKVNENNLFYQLPPSKLKIIIKKFSLNNYQLIFTQLIIIHATPDSPILRFTQVTQYILSVTYAMNFSGAIFWLVFWKFFSLTTLNKFMFKITTNLGYFMATSFYSNWLTIL